MDGLSDTSIVWPVVLAGAVLSVVVWIVYVALGVEAWIQAYRHRRYLKESQWQRQRRRQSPLRSRP